MSYKALYRSMASIAGAAVAAQAVVGLSAPILTRIFSPADLGFFGAYQAAVMIAAVFVTLRFEFAIPNIKDDEEVPIFGALIVLTIICTTAALVVLTLLWIKLGLPTGQFGHYLLFLPLGASFFAAHEALRFLILRHGAYKVVAITSMSRSIAQVFYQVIVGLISANTLTLISSHFVSLLVAIGGMVRGASTKRIVNWQDLRSSQSIRSLWNLAKNYSSYPKYMMPLGIVNMLGQQLPAIVFLFVFAPSFAGYFAVAQRLIGLPMTLVGKAVGDVFFGEYARIIRVNEGGGARLFKGMVKRLAFCAIPVCIVPFLIPQSVYEYVLGAEWGAVKHTLDFLGITFAAQILVTPLAQTMIILQQQKKLFLWDSLRLVMVALICLSPLVFKIPYIEVVMIYSVMTAIWYLILLRIMWKEVHKL